MNSFNEIYILDLHGSTQGKKKSPDGSKDKNVFDIKQGVAIGLFIKKKGQRKECNVYHSEIFGSREKKYEWLLRNDIKITKWQPLSPKSETYLFVPRENSLLESYEKYPRITQIFPLNGVGMTTARDSFVIDRDKKMLLDRIRLFKNSKYSDEELHSFFQINRKKGWSIRKAWDTLQSISDTDLDKFIIPVLYRPFDVRWIFYHDALVWRTAKKVMLHMTQENVALITARSNKSYEMDHFFCSDKVMETKCGESTTQSCLFPLYLYPDIGRKELFSNKNKQVNISRDILTAFSRCYKDKPAPERILYYIYAVFYSNDYRTKYTNLLRTDFPRIPFTIDYELFCKMASLGNRLINLHLFKSSELDPPLARFQGKGDYKVKKIIYEKERVYINNDQYFEGNREVWEYQIGGYKVCDRWLKDRKEKADVEERPLSLDDIKQYCKIVTALGRTIEIQKVIDSIYPEIERKTITF